MSLEADFTQLIMMLCPRITPDVADVGTQTPYVIWEQVGGTSLRFLDGTAADKRRAEIQFTVWHTTRGAANALMLQIEDLLCTSTATLQAQPLGGLGAGFDDADELKGAVMSFSIWGAR
ncbi:DUF3168 domain-containing protein [Acidovorax sp. Root217]|uniref:tail completion protein gp17 n=1 Tax=Acidovorax sp. Root217 TaxID=1736492 RepID=UPI0007101F79|nr:DUF3168 domain-containing protein [Acidovorax sp. Root217]KRC30682.1 hypothetical protein ASE31_00420 [Acidovorax sp. Root217]